MFVETIALPRLEWERSGVNIWDSPAAIPDFYMERVRPIVELEGEPTNKPQRHGEPLAFYLRQ